MSLPELLLMILSGRLVTGSQPIPKPIDHHCCCARHVQLCMRNPSSSTTCSLDASLTHSDASNDWGVPSALLMPLSPRSDVSLKTFYKEITEDQRLLEEYEATHPRPDNSWDLSTTAPAAAQADVRERWHQEFETSPDMVLDSTPAHTYL
ncbi:hypothetical protein B0H10DRAFT_2219858 [Mycena sp. CBHHK59/15]|nr:hypothetical protein B0H10DRAFT_2219858 [Mycena sp. CBHHK59/15]